MSSGADQGMAALRRAWEAAPKEQRATFKAALDRRYKPRAMEVDEAKRAAQPAESAAE